MLEPFLNGRLGVRFCEQNENEYRVEFLNEVSLEDIPRYVAREIKEAQEKGAD